MCTNGLRGRPLLRKRPCEGDPGPARARADPGGFEHHRSTASLQCLALLLALNGDAFDPERARREVLKPGRTAEFKDLLRVAKAEGLKARLTRSSAARLDALVLPALGRSRNGAFFVLGRRVPEGVLVGVAGGAPALWTPGELDAWWTGEVLLAVKRANTRAAAAAFGIGWFMPVIKRFGRILAEVLAMSVFIQLIALMAPSFFQVVIDKVLVHRGLTTLQVLVIGLLACNVADASLNWLRTYTFTLRERLCRKLQRSAP